MVVSIYVYHPEKGCIGKYKSIVGLIEFGSKMGPLLLANLQKKFPELDFSFDAHVKKYKGARYRVIVPGCSPTEPPIAGAIPFYNSYSYPTAVKKLKALANHGYTNAYMVRIKS